MLFGFCVPPRLWDDEVVKPAPQYAKSWRGCKFPDIGDLQSIRYRLSCIVGLEVIFVDASPFGHLLPDVLRRPFPYLSDAEPTTWVGLVHRRPAWDPYRPTNVYGRQSHLRTLARRPVISGTGVFTESSRLFWWAFRSSSDDRSGTSAPSSFTTRRRSSCSSSPAAATSTPGSRCSTTVSPPPPWAGATAHPASHATPPPCRPVSTSAMGSIA